ncbi:MAG: response regulator [Rhizobiales bacterium]|nr:response regulator [Hyphomicrobiales bacterium]|tara:strand:+ start:3011 stop:3220 length:210 start_codon:yes stop_codon:yes gene_type:complete
MSDDLSEHILIVDDDVQLRRMLRRFLEDEGFSVSEAADAEGTHRTLNSRKVDLITLDLGLGRADGVDFR